MCDDMPMPKTDVICENPSCRWRGKRHPDRALLFACPRCREDVMLLDEYYAGQRKMKAMMDAAYNEEFRVRSL